MIRNGEASLEGAAARLTRAIDALEARLAAARAAPPAVADTGELDALQAELRERRLRERALEGAAAEASSVLGRAAEQIRAALEDEETGEETSAAESPPVEPEEAPSLDHLSDDQTDLHPTPSREF